MSLTKLFLCNKVDSMLLIGLHGIKYADNWVLLVFLSPNMGGPVNILITLIWKSIDVFETMNHHAEMNYIKFMSTKNLFGNKSS